MSKLPITREPQATRASRNPTPRADVAAFERLTQALVGITAQSLDALDGTVTVSRFRLLRHSTPWAECPARPSLPP